MAVYRKKFISLDLETTHLDAREGKIIEVAAVEVELFIGKEGNVEVRLGENFESLLNPETTVPAAVLALTGIKEEELKGAPKWSEVKSKFKDFLGDSILLGHNLGFDLDFLAAAGLKIKNPILDTLEIAQTVLPTAPSHSLESLAESFGVLGEQSHRALQDCRSTARLLVSALNEFLSLPADLQKEIKNYLQESKIRFREVILDLPEIQILPSPALRASSPARGEEDKDIIFDWPDKTILSLPWAVADWLPAVVNRKKPGIVGLPHRFYLDFVPEEQRLCDPGFALCEVRLENLRNRDKLSDAERKILIKTAIYRKASSRLDLGAIKWTPEERDLLHHITAQPGLCPVHGCAYAKNLDFDENRTRFATHDGLMQLAARWPVKFSCPLLLAELAAAEDIFSQSLVQTWNLKSVRQALARGTDTGELLNEADLFFGILHLVYRKREEDFAENLIADASDAADERYRKLFHPAEKFVGKIRTAAEELASRIPLIQSGEDLETANLKAKLFALADFLESFFLKQQPQYFYWLRFTPPQRPGAGFNAETVDLNSAPRDLQAAWRDLEKKFSSVTIADQDLPEAAMKYFQNRLGIADYRRKNLGAGGPRAKTPLTLFEQPLAASDIVKFLSGLAGSSVVILPNERQLKSFFEELSSASGRKLLAHKISGNPERIKSKMDRETILLLTQSAAARYWRAFPPAHNLVILRLPFEAPGARRIPEAAAPDFKTEVLPRAIYSLHTLLQKFLRACAPPGHIYLLDPRAATDYDREILRYLMDLPGVDISTIDKW